MARVSLKWGALFNFFVLLLVLFFLFETGMYRVRKPYTRLFGFNKEENIVAEDQNHQSNDNPPKEEKRLEKTRRRPEHEEVTRLEKIADRLDEVTTKGRFKDMAYHFTSPKEVIKTNLIAGIARGVGLTLGTAIFLALLIFILNLFVSAPLVGEYIADMLDFIDEQRENGEPGE